MSSPVRPPILAIHALKKFADVLHPEDCEPPILSPAIRQVLRQWLVEMTSEEELSRYGVKARRTAMLSGPPGCGKTTLAHHFAARLGLPLVLVNMASVVSSFVGESGRNINAVFDEVAKQPDQCILFLDEFDSIASKRGAAKDAAGSERNGIVVSILQKIDSFQGTLIAATNLADNIDPAIWRRFGMHMAILEPGTEERFAILKRYLMPLEMTDDALDIVTDATNGATPAILRQLMEGVKRDLVISPKCGQSVGAADVFGRLVASISPHGSVDPPPLWSNPHCMSEVARIDWPPTMRK
jgi:SpoVK/Ycf46/Vps4 family AAA+-type ATPase